MSDSPQQAPEPGCYIDSHHGHYGHPQVVRIAQDKGFTVGPFAQWALDTYDESSWADTYPNEAMIELSDEAIAWLNEHRALEGHVWEWNDGDFGLYPCEDDSVGELGRWANDG